MADLTRARWLEALGRAVPLGPGKIQQWDVANEIFNGDGTLRPSDNIWIRELGPEIIADAFRWAHEADPKAKLFATTTAWKASTRRALLTSDSFRSFWSRASRWTASLCRAT